MKIKNYGYIISRLKYTKYLLFTWYEKGREFQKMFK